MKIPWKNIKEEIEKIKDSKLVMALALIIMLLAYVTLFNPFGWFIKK